MSKALEQAIKILGGQSAAAAFLHVPQPTVHFWLKKSKQGLPAQHCEKVEKATGIPANKLRPDVFGGRA